MSQLDQGFALDRYDRRGRPAPPRTGITESLTVPGLAVTPPVRSDTADRLLAAVDAIGNTVGLLGARARQERLDIEAAERDAEVQAAEADRLMQGQASLDYRTMLPQLVSDIESGKTPMPEDVGAYLDDFVDQRTAGQPTAYRKGFEQIRPALAQAFVNRQDKLRADAQVETLRLYGSAATEAAAAGDIAGVLAEARGKFPDMTDLDLRGAVVMPALKSAAAAGDEVRFKAAIEALGDGFDVEKAQATNAFEEATTQKRFELVRTFRDEIAAGYIDEVPFGTIRNKIRGWRGRVPDDAIDQQLREVDIREAQSLRDALDRSVQQELEAKRSAIVEAARPVLASGNPLIDDQVITTADGKTHPFKRSDIIDAAREADFAEIDRRFPLDRPDTAAQNLSARLRWLSRVPEARDPNLERLWAGFSSRITPDLTDAALPPAMVAGYLTFREAEQQAPGVVAAHLNDADREVLRAASFVQDQIPGMTPAAALISAVRASSKGVILSDAISRELSGQKLSAALRSELDGDAANHTDASRIIERRARAYMLAYGSSEENAIKEATKRFKEDHSLLNGHYVNTVRRPVAKAIDANLMGEAVVNAWARAAGEDPADYTLIPDRDATSWYIAQAGVSVPAPGTPRISDAEIMQLDRWWKAMDTADAEDRTMFASRQGREDRPTPVAAAKYGKGLAGYFDPTQVFRRDREALRAFWGRGTAATGGPPEPTPIAPNATTPEPPLAASIRPALQYLINKRLGGQKTPSTSETLGEIAGQGLRFQ